jgi:hypothetical protein
MLWEIEPGDINENRPEDRILERSRVKRLDEERDILATLNIMAFG